MLLNKSLKYKAISIKKQRGTNIAWERPQQCQVFEE